MSTVNGHEFCNESDPPTILFLNFIPHMAKRIVTQK